MFSVYSSLNHLSRSLSRKDLTVIFASQIVTLTLLSVAVGCSHRHSERSSEKSPDQLKVPPAHVKTTSTSRPTSHPSSQPSGESPDSQARGRAVATSKVAHWGSGSFGQALSPQALHRPADDQGVAIFAGGCFWCMEAPFESLNGVEAVYSGYTGGEESHPTYSQVSASRTHHLEAVLVYYRPSEISYDALLKRFWRSINPTQADGQFADRGPQYRTAIFSIDATQAQAALESKTQLERSGKFSDPIAVQLLKSATFWPAEDYHQDYYKTHSAHYQRYKVGSGRAGYLKKTWSE